MKRVALLALLCVAAATVSGASAQARCAPTFNDGAGPFARGAPPLRAKIGTGHVLTGVVLSTDCKPLAGARIQLWQANRNYVYTRARQRHRDHESELAGSGSKGRDRRRHDGRPAHIHLRVIAEGHEILYARYVPRAGLRSAGRSGSCSSRAL